MSRGTSATPSARTDERESAMSALVTPDRLQRLFAPRSVAIVGASDTSAWSQLIVSSLEMISFDGQLVPVHPRHKSAHGRPTVPSLRDREEPVDLAYVLAPQHAVENVLEDAAAAGVHNAIVLAAGYGESGAQGLRRQRRLVDVAIRSDVTILGPNGLGYVNVPARVAPFGLGIAEPVKSGHVGVVLQSGMLASTVLDVMRARNVGMSLLVSMGNEAMVSTADVIEYLIEDESTKVITLFLEGIRNSERFIDLVVRAADAGKPVVAMKVGSSPAGQSSAAAHTGAVAGDDAVVDAAFRQFGVIRVRSLEEMVVTAGLLAEGPQLAGRRMGVITASGGCNGIIVDRAYDEGIKIPALTPATTARLLERAVPEFGSARNPVDVTGVDAAGSPDSEESSGSAALEAVTEDPRVDFVLFMGAYFPVTEPEGWTQIQAQNAHIAKVMADSRVPVICASEALTSLSHFQRQAAEELGIHLVGGIEFALTAIGHAVRWDERRHRLRRRRPAMTRPKAIGYGPDNSDGSWSEIQGRRLLTEAGIPTVPTVFARTLDEALEAAADIGYPVVLKAHAPGVLHKSDLGGVQLDLGTPAEVRLAFDAIADGVGAVAKVEGVLVSPRREDGIELIAGVTQDPIFGPTLAVGLGGVWVELLNDVSLRVLPVGRTDVVDMLNELKSAPLLHGHRGHAGVNIRQVADVISRLSTIAGRLGPSLNSLEVNPFWCCDDQVEALDVLVVTH